MFPSTSAGGFAGFPRPRLSDADLRIFKTPTSWRALSLVRPFRSADWWRDAVMEADECGRGLLEWDRKTRRWSLSDEGRTHLGYAPKEDAKS